MDGRIRIISSKIKHIKKTLNSKKASKSYAKMMRHG